MPEARMSVLATIDDALAPVDVVGALCCGGVVAVVVVDVGGDVGGVGGTEVVGAGWLC